ncbi:hypothetical protein JTB14_019757 [Gonioctena quinquepunctata]|nr:hypothetical protein JTB14_019757 [Gonioctena quinquepunctata]
MAKNRVAPIKQSSNDSLTLPKLELTASLCVFRLSKYIEEKLSIVTNQISILSDSKIALYWIRGDPSRWKPYVANRMNQIRELSNMITFWKRRESLLERFCKFWISEYLQQLRSAHFTIFKRSSGFRVGQVVLLYEQGLPRLLWKLARKKEVFPGRDGYVRACLIRLGNGTLLRRPVQLLYPLKIENDIIFGPGKDVKNSNQEEIIYYLPVTKDKKRC